MTDKKRKRSRLLKNIPQRIDADGETILKAIFAEADSRIEKSRG